MGTENKPRYIDANYLEQFAMPIKDHTGKIEKVVQYEHIINAPTADVQEIKHAKWVKNEYGYYECSNCESLQPYDGIDFLNPNKATYWDCDYCRSCGAKMDEVEK